MNNQCTHHLEVEYDPYVGERPSWLRCQKTAGHDSNEFHRTYTGKEFTDEQSAKNTPV